MTSLAAVLGLAATLARGSALIASLPAPGDAAAGFASAGAAYEAGRVAEARDAYARLAAAGTRTPALCYNLGNACWRLGERGRAVLWYERARRLAPRDEDIRFNLALARAALGGEAGSAWELVDRLVTPRELAWAVVLLAWRGGGGAGGARGRGGPAAEWRGRLTAGVAALAAASALLAARGQDLDRPWGVVVRPGVEVRSGPGDQFTVGFTVPEGRRTLLLNRRPGWAEIGVPRESLKGWVPEEAVERL